jgi:hypothetical protein
MHISPNTWCAWSKTQHKSTIKHYKNWVFWSGDSRAKLAFTCNNSDTNKRSTKFLLPYKNFVEHLVSTNKKPQLEAKIENGNRARNSALGHNHPVKQIMKTQPRQTETKANWWKHLLSRSRESAPSAAGAGERGLEPYETRTWTDPLAEKNETENPVRAQRKSETWAGHWPARTVIPGVGSCGSSSPRAGNQPQQENGSRNETLWRETCSAEETKCAGRKEKWKNPKTLQQICNPGEPKITVAINSTSRRTSQLPKIRARKIDTHAQLQTGALNKEESLRSDCTKSKCWKTHSTNKI